MRTYDYATSDGRHTAELAVADGHEPPDEFTAVEVDTRGARYSHRLLRQFTWAERLERARKQVALATAENDWEAARSAADDFVGAWLAADGVPMQVGKTDVLEVWNLSRGRDG